MEEMEIKLSENGSFRKKKVKFSQVSNDALRDKELSLKAKGLYSLIQSYITIENFILYKNTLKKCCKEGGKAFESAWKELKDRGYLVQYKYKNNSGTFYYEYDLLDEIQTPEKDSMVSVEVEKVDDGKGGIYNKTKSNNTNFNNTHSKYGEKKNNFNNFEQRTYDFDDLEKRLLGWDKIEG